MSSGLPDRDSTRKIRDEAKDSTAFSKNIIATINQGLLVGDLEDIIIKCNPRAAEMFGCSEDKLIGRDQKELVWDKENLDILSEQHQKRAAGQKSVYELVWRRLDNNQQLYTLISASPHYIDDEYAGNKGLLTDITERKLKEKEEEKIRALNRLKIAHEINNGLGGLARCIGILREAIKDPELLLILDDMSASIEDQVTGARTALLTGKMGSGKKEKYDLNQFIKERIDELKRRRYFAAYQLSENYFSAPLGVQMDILTVKNVFYNLVKNASKFTRGEITIGTQPSHDRIFGEFYVADNGPGISSEMLPKLFEAHATTGGFGLGLYTAKENVEEHGGYINVETTPGQGSKFTVGLPIHKKA